MTEHQIHIITRIILALMFFIGLTALFGFISRRRSKKISVETKRIEKVEFLNFDEPRQRRANNRRGKRLKKGGK